MILRSTLAAGLAISLVATPSLLRAQAGASEPASTSATTADPSLAQVIEAMTARKPIPPEQLPVYERVAAAAAAADLKNNRAQFCLVLVERAQGKKAEQLERMKKVAKAEPKNAQYQYELGQCYMASLAPDMGMLTMADRTGEACDAWERALEIDPNHVFARYGAAQYYIQARKQGGFLFGSYSKAREHSETLLKLPDGRGEFWGHIALAQLAAAQEKWAEMSREFAAAESARGEGADPVLALRAHAGALVNDKKDAAAALPVIDRMAAATTDPKDTSVPYYRGLAFKLLGQCDKASEQFQIVLSVNPAAQNTRFALAECLDKMGDTPAAISQYEEFARRFPTDGRTKQAEAAVKRLRKSATRTG